MLMLVARDRDGGRTIGYRARRGERYFCPACGADVLPRKGSIRIHHFAHVAESGCPYSRGETALHLEMKHFFHDYYSRSPCVKRVEVEWPVDGLVADVYLDEKSGARVAIECQVSGIDVRELMKRTVGFSRQGIHLLWIVAGRPDLDAVISRLKNSRTASLPHRANEIEKRLQQLYYGRFYYFFNGTVHPLHMEAAERWVNGSCEGCPRQIGCTPEARAACEIYRPGFMALMNNTRQVTMGMLRGYRPLCIERRGGLRLARFMDKRWWSTSVKSRE